MCATHSALETPIALPSGGVEEIAAQDLGREAEARLWWRREGLAEIVCNMLLQAASEDFEEHRPGAR